MRSVPTLQEFRLGFRASREFERERSSPSQPWPSAMVTEVKKVVREKVARAIVSEG